jgi:hypothetical protein
MSIIFADAVTPANARDFLLTPVVRGNLALVPPGMLDLSEQLVQGILALCPPGDQRYAALESVRGALTSIVRARQ